MTTANSGLTIAKLIRCAAMLNANHAPEPYIDPYEIMRQMARSSGQPRQQTEASGMTTTHAKPGRKPNGRAALNAIIQTTQQCYQACTRAKIEKRPVEFIVQLDSKPRWAWPDGTVTSPESLRQRMRNLKFRRAKHGEVMP